MAPLNNEDYIVLARRTRPQSFADLVGQEAVAKSVEGMISRQQIPHAFLFTGTRGTGKTSSARILAKSLCCVNGPTITPCQTCVHCTHITSCSHDDIFEIDGASNTGVDNIRELRESARFYPHSARYKIYIIDEVHMLSTGAFNALLKTLEEPPPQVIFILATTELQKVPITVRSRCMIFSFKKIAPETILNHLKNILLQEKISYEEDALQIIAREARGSLRDSLSLLEQAIAICGGTHLSLEGTQKGLCVQGEEQALQLFAAICQKQIPQALDVLKDADIQNVDLAVLLENTAQLFHHALCIKQISSKERALRFTQLLPAELDFIQTHASSLSTTALGEVFRTLLETAKDATKSSAALSWCEVAAIDCIARADWLSAGETWELLHSQNSSPKPTEKVGNKPAEKPVERVIAKPIEQPTPPEKKNEFPGHSDRVNFDLYQKFVSIAESKSKTLSAKLRLAKVEEFSTEAIYFSDVAENATFFMLSPDDLRFFWESLKEAGLENIPLKGKHIPQRTIPISLAGKEKLEKDKDRKQREERILKTESVQNLMKIATDVQVIHDDA